MSKPIIYIASPYTKGDPAINTRFQCEVFDRLLTDGKVTPIAPLWSHFQHLIFPRPYEDWTAYDLEIVQVCNACLRLNAEHSPMEYRVTESSGADGEEAEFEAMGRPVFYSIEDLYRWVDEVWSKA
jgi:hypothetical protein